MRARLSYLSASLSMTAAPVTVKGRPASDALT